MEFQKSPAPVGLFSFMAPSNLQSQKASPHFWNV